MKILYGVQGTGNGHIARARIMATAFAKRPEIEVDFLFSGREAEKYFDMDVFGSYETRRGLSFITHNGELKRLKTVREAKLLELKKDIDALDLTDYDLVLNDFEPISAWAAKRQKVPSLSISHQAAFTCNIPTEQESFIDRIITKYFAPTQFSLGVHWYHFNQNIIPPFVPEDMQQTNNAQSSFILVYLPFESTSTIEQVLLTLSDYTFHCYHPDIKQTRIDKNIHWFSPSKTQFHQDLVDTEKVIANGGFELATECLSLGKALLMKPLTGQFEQFSNAYTLRKLGAAATLYHLDSELIEDWLDSTTAIKIAYQSNPSVFIDWILSGQWDDTSSICKQLWQQVEFPADVSQKLAQINLS
jgi:uncharacterized protein (TIGR00661 family)